MNTEEFIKNISETYEKAVLIVRDKNHDYAKDADPFSNFRLSQLIGLPVEKAILMRLCDKIARVDNLLKKEAKVKDESITDTIVDAVNYLAILKAYIDGKKMP